MKVSGKFDQFSSQAKAAGLEGDSLGAKMGGAGEAFTKLGAATVAVGGVVAVASLKMAGDWQASMVKLVTSAGETGSVINGKLTGEIANVSKGLLQMSVDTATSTDQLAKGMYYVESAGFHAAAGLQVMKVAAEGARAEGADLKEVADALTTVLNDYFPGAADKSVAAMDMMVKAVSEGKTSMQMFSSSLSTVLPVAHAAGIEFPEVAGAIATMTAEGVTAQQATQNLAFTIRSLQAPSSVAVKAMAAMGLNATDVSKNLGTKGLTGTLDDLTTAITQHMGPSGLVLQSAFNQSKNASEEANIAITKMPKNLAELAQQFQSGTISTKDFVKATKDLPANQFAMAKQFQAVEMQAQGFNDQIKAGGPAAQTYTSVLKQMMGGAAGLNTALLLTGSSLDTFKGNVNGVADAGAHAGKDIDNWATITETFNFKLAALKQTANKFMIELGTELIPIVQSVVGWFEKHKIAVEVLAGVITAVLAVAVLKFVQTMTTSLITTIAKVVEVFTKFGNSAKTAAVETEALGNTSQAASAKVKGLGTATSVAAAETDAAKVSAGGWASKLGNSLPIIGLVVTGVAMLGDKLGKMSGVGDHTAISVDKLNTAMLGLAKSTPQAQQDMVRLGIALGKGSQVWGEPLKGLKDYDQSLANLVSSGHASDAAAIISQIAAATGKHGDKIVNVTKDFPAYLSAVDAATNAAKQQAVGTDDASTSLDNNSTALGNNAAAVAALNDATSGADQTLTDFQDSMQKQQAVDQFNQDLNNLTDSVKNNGAALDGNSQAGIANRQALQGAAQQAVDFYQQQMNSKTPIADVSKKLDEQVDSLKKTATQAGLSKDAVSAYLDKLGLLKLQSDLHTQVTIDVDTSQLRAAQTKINQLGVGSVGGSSTGHGIKVSAFADGGWVPGAPGKPMLAIVHGGEYVVSDKMQSGYAGVDPKVFSGIPSANRSSGSVGGGGATTVVVNVTGSVIAERDLRDFVETQMLRLGARRSTTYTPYSR